MFSTSSCLPQRQRDHHSSAISITLNVSWLTQENNSLCSFTAWTISRAGSTYIQAPVSKGSTRNSWQPTPIALLEILTHEGTDFGCSQLVAGWHHTHSVGLWVSTFHCFQCTTPQKCFLNGFGVSVMALVWLLQRCYLSGQLWVKLLPGMKRVRIQISSTWSQCENCQLWSDPETSAKEVGGTHQVTAPVG